MKRLILSCLLLTAPALVHADEGSCDHCPNHQNAATRDERVSLDTSRGPALGPASAKVTVVVFADFECPYCRRAVATLHSLAQKYGDQLRLVFRNRPLPLHAHAKLAAEAALAADAQGHFWEFHDWLFSPEAKLDLDSLVAEADHLGLDAARFRADVTGNRYAARIAQDEQEADELDVAGTPTFFVNGLRVTGLQPQVLEELVDAELRR